MSLKIVASSQKCETSTIKQIYLILKFFMKNRAVFDNYDVSKSEICVLFDPLNDFYTVSSVTSDIITLSGTIEVGDQYSYFLSSNGFSLLDFSLKKLVILKYLPKKYSQMILSKPLNDNLIEALY